MSEAEMILSGLFSIFSSFMGAFAGGGSTTLLLSFLLLTSSSSFLTLLTLSKVAGFSMVMASGTIHRRHDIVDSKMAIWAVVTSSLGIALGTYFAEYHLDEKVLTNIVAYTLIFLAIYQTFFSKSHINSIRKEKFSVKEYLISGVFFFTFNILNAITGGMGLIFVAFYVGYLHTSYIQGAAYSMMAGIPIIGGQALYLVYRTQPSFLWIGLIVVGSLLGGYLGTHFQYKKGDVWVKHAATLMMVVLAVLTFT